MKRRKHILARYDDGRQVVILEIDAATSDDVSSSEKSSVRYELANRSQVVPMSDTEFVVVRTGQVLTRIQQGTSGQVQTKGSAGQRPDVSGRSMPQRKGTDSG